MNKSLRELEQSGEYLFHGSPTPGIEVMEARQGRHVPDLTKPNEVVLDGEPAISATPFLDIAIFMAVVSGANISGKFNSGYGFEGGAPVFRVHPGGALEQALKKKGYIYVFPKSDFTPYDREGRKRPIYAEWRSPKSLRPLCVFQVALSDMTIKDIKIAQMW